MHPLLERFIRHMDFYDDKWWEGTHQETGWFVMTKKQQKNRKKPATPIRFLEEDDEDECETG